ncbi:glycoside hydrolase 43 family protein [Paenibacillus sp. 11B]|nr:glycoside hydrolase 43 family protein [Paenibacillus sp. 11B]MDN8588659.1 glycoside hydrolase 43 family protein [Paenibacillus sp. 11B]
MKISIQEQQVWLADLGNGRYQNPILHTDYADPDVIRVESDFYMVASSFCSSPGIPILHSKDLIHWTIINYVYDRLPYEYYDTVRPSEGAWAPSIRYHDGQFWVFFSMPDHGIFMSSAVDPMKKWSKLHLVKEVKGWIDPCPFWDEDGQAYLVIAFAQSRCGLKSVLGLSRMKPDGTGLLDDPVHIFDGTVNHPTIEGPKLYKRGEFYYIFAPAGGVRNGWQTILRSKNIYGPYEDKIVLHQGNSNVNGPHQGGWIELESGESWFLHFQDKGAYGRIIHLQPVEWVDNWPVMGHNHNEQGIGEPVQEWAKPDVGGTYPINVPVVSDHFNDPSLHLQWQWAANEKPEWYSLSAKAGFLRLYAVKPPNGPETLLYDVPNVLCQKISSPSYTVTAKLMASSIEENDHAGVVITGREYASVSLTRCSDDRERLKISLILGFPSEGRENEYEYARVEADKPLYLRVSIAPNALCIFSYSLDNVHFKQLGPKFEAQPDHWVGSKIGLFCINKGQQENNGYIDFDWISLDKNTI